MLLAPWLKSLASPSRRRPAARRSNRPQTAAEVLEDRTLLSGAPVATISGAESTTDGVPYTLELSTLNAGTISQWTINWGDGTPLQNVPGNPSSVEHTFHGAGSTHVIRAAATDETGTFDALFADGDLVIPGYTSHNVLRYDGDTGALIDVFVPSTSGGLRHPVGAAFGPDGNYYVASYAADDVLRYDGQSGAFIDEFVPAGLGGLDGSLDVVFGPDRNLYVSSAITDNVLRYDGATGAFIDVFASGNGLNDPRGLIFGPDGNLYVSSEVTDSVERFDGDTGAALGSFVPPGSGGLDFPEGLLFGPDGNLYVASRATDSVLRYDGATGDFLDVFVPSGSGGLNAPIDMVFGPDGNFYVSSLSSNEVLRYDGLTGGVIDTFINTASDGLTLPAYLNYEPLAVTVEPSSFVVTNTNDSGAGSLRQAITDANTAPGDSEIVFNIPTTDANFVDVDSGLAGGDAAPDAFLIQPLTDLPALNDPNGGTTIAGRTQTAFTGDTNPFGPEIILDGSLRNGGNGLVITSDNNAVFGLTINQFPLVGIKILGNNNWIAGNYVGLDATGTIGQGNGSGVNPGINVEAGASFNLIGTNADGVDDIQERNVISGNFGRGIGIKNLGTSNNVVAGNYIGTDATGTFALGNTGPGVAIDAGGSNGSGATDNRIGTNGDGNHDDVEHNVISGNLAIGVAIGGAGTDRNIVAGNYIGTDATGTLA